jgi:predicted metalloprotease
MRYGDFRRSDGGEDRRDDGGGIDGGGGFGIPMGGGRLGIGTIIILGLVSYAFGTIRHSDRRRGEFDRGNQRYEADQVGPVKTGAPTDEMGSMIPASSADRRSLERNLPGQRATYAGRKSCCFATPPTARCGMAQAAMGPFYCPPDKTIYLDTGFFRRSRPGFAAVRSAQVHGSLHHRP